MPKTKLPKSQASKAKKQSNYIPRLRKHFLEDKPECEERCGIQYDDPNFVDGHASVVERIKSFSREAELSVVEAVNPVVGKAEHAKPDYEDHIVEARL
jgi:hypothetical protein